MRLLICTQAVDLDDPVLAFFHHWIEELARNAEHVHVICLKEGRHELPKNVSVHSLGKESGRSLFKYVSRFYHYIWSLRRDYDAVFVHMNPEYAVLGGLLWRLTGKRVGLWYIHPRSSARLRVAAVFTKRIFSASKDSFPFATPKLVPLGHGIDTDFFSPGECQESSMLRIMHVGRIAPVKRIEIILAAVHEVGKRGIPVSFDQYGDALSRDVAYEASILEQARSLSNVSFKGKSTAEEIRDAYRTHDVHVNATPSGSFDKAVLESMASGTLTLASNTALSDALPEELRFEEGDADSLADTLEKISRMSAGDRDSLQKRLREIAEERYSLPALIGTIVTHLAL